MIHIRNRYLQKYHEEAGNYRQAYHYLEKNNRLDDSIRNERVRMRTADLNFALSAGLYFDGSQGVVSKTGK